MQVKTEMKRKVRMEPEGGTKKGKEVGNESPWASMFQKQQTDNDLQQARKMYNAILQKGKQFGMDETAHADPVHRSENDTHPIQCRVGYGGCNSGCNSVKTKCEPEVSTKGFRSGHPNITICCLWCAP